MKKALFPAARSALIIGSVANPFYFKSKNHFTKKTCNFQKMALFLKVYKIKIVGNTACHCQKFLFFVPRLMFVSNIIVKTTTMIKKECLSISFDKGHFPLST